MKNVILKIQCFLLGHGRLEIEEFYMAEKPYSRRVICTRCGKYAEYEYCFAQDGWIETEKTRDMTKKNWWFLANMEKDEDGNYLHVDMTYAPDWGKAKFKAPLGDVDRRDFRFYEMLKSSIEASSVNPYPPEQAGPALGEYMEHTKDL